MIRKRTRAATVAAVGVVGLVLTGCSSADPGDGADGGDASAIVTTNGSEPRNPLYPGNTSETGGGKITTLIYSSLVDYNVDGEVILEDAESIEPNDDNTVWTVTLREGLQFSNGDPLTAESYINAWNFSANLANAQGAQAFFENIEGYSAEEETDLSGLELVDDLTFTVTLNQPQVDFVLPLGYDAFSPLPDAAFEDIDAFGQSPIGSGPYQLASEDAWENNVGIDLVANENYSGPREPQNGGVSIIFYTSIDTAYADAQSGNLDIIDRVPAATLASYEDEFPGRSVNEPAAIIHSFTIPYYLDHFGDDEEGQLRRLAFSKAVDREAIIESIFDGTREVADDYTAPMIEGWSDSLEGVENLQYDPEGARELWEQANEIAEYDDTFTIAYNADDDHQPWVEAVLNSIAAELEIQTEGMPIPTFTEYLEYRQSGEATGAYRTSWQGTYPGIDYYLESLYRTGAENNDAQYSSEAFDTAFDDASTQATTEEAIAKYQEAEEVLLQDLPGIPLWYGASSGAWSEAVDNVEFGWDSVPAYEKVTKE